MNAQSEVRTRRLAIWRDARVVDGERGALGLYSRLLGVLLSPWRRLSRRPHFDHMEAERWRQVVESSRVTSSRPTIF